MPPKKIQKRAHAGRPVPTRTKVGAPPGLDIEASPKRQVYLTDVALRDGHQSLLATRMRTEVLSTTVYLEMQAGNLQAALGVSLIMIAFAVVVLVITRSIGLKGGVI